jgi:hypothetical protein
LSKVENEKYLSKKGAFNGLTFSEGKADVCEK